MGEDSILSFEGVIVLVPDFSVIWIPVHSTASLEVFDLGDSFLSVVDRSVKNSRYLASRINIITSSYDIVWNTASIAESFAHPNFF